jgi:hypothetical protein
VAEGIPLSCALPPLPPVAKVVEKTFGSIQVAATLLHDPDQVFFISSVTQVLDPLPGGEGINSKRTLLQKGSTVTKRATMERGRTLVGLGLFCSSPMSPHRRYL